jgi:WD40 repeat protein
VDTSLSAKGDVSRPIRQRCKLISAQRSGREIILAMECPPIIEEDVTINTKQNKKQFVTCGKGGAIKFWNFNNQLLSFSKKMMRRLFFFFFSRCLDPFEHVPFDTFGVSLFLDLIFFLFYIEHGVYGKIGPTSTMMSLGFKPDGNAVTGSADGRLYCWEGRTLTRLIHATPSSAILSLFSTASMAHGGSKTSGRKSASGSKKGGGIVTGSSDGRVRMWDSADNMRPGTT